MIFKCGDCDYRTDKEAHLRNHRAFIHADGLMWHRCNMCDHRSKSAGNLAQHKRSVHNFGKMLQCRSCNFETDTYLRLRRHREAEHPDEPTLSRTPYKCDRCETIAFGKRQMRRHRLEFHNIREFDGIWSCETLCAVSDEDWVRAFLADVGNVDHANEIV